MQTCVSLLSQDFLTRLWLACAVAGGFVRRWCRPHANANGLALVAAGCLPPPQEPELPPSDEEPDVQDRFAAWEVGRAEELQMADDCERQGLQLLHKAALLRTAVHCDDKGLMFVAEALRERAKDDDTDDTEVMSDGSERTTLEVATACDEDDPTF